MATNFFLANKGKEKSSIDVIVQHRSERYKRAVGASVETAYWLNGRCRQVKEYPPGKSINIRLQKIEEACESVCNKFLSEIDIPSEKEFWSEVDKILSGCADKKLSFAAFFEKYISDLKNVMKKGSVKPFESALSLLKEYEESRNKTLFFKNIDLAFYNDFKTFMATKNMSENYFGTIMKKIKKTYNDAREIYRLHEYDNASGFKCPSNIADSIYLNEDEILKIFKLDITPELIREHFPDIQDIQIKDKITSCNVARNKFLAGYCTALRISDVQKMADVNMINNQVKIYTKKTEVPVIIPVHWILKEIIEGGFDLQTKLSDQRVNDRIKEVCKMAGINEMVQVSRKEISKTIVSNVPKYALVTTHTARRSGATNMYKSGIPTHACMKITGHTTEEDFFKYIKITTEENAELLAKHSFFTNKKEEDNGGGVDDKLTALQDEFGLSPEELIKKLVDIAAKRMINDKK